MSPETLAIAVKQGGFQTDTSSAVIHTPQPKQAEKPKEIIVVGETEQGGIIIKSIYASGRETTETLPPQAWEKRKQQLQQVPVSQDPSTEKVIIDTSRPTLRASAPVRTGLNWEPLLLEEKSPTFKSPFARSKDAFIPTTPVEKFAAGVIGGAVFAPITYGFAGLQLGREYLMTGSHGREFLLSKGKQTVSETYKAFTTDPIGSSAFLAGSVIGGSAWTGAYKDLKSTFSKPKITKIELGGASSFAKETQRAGKVTKGTGTADIQSSFLQGKKKTDLTSRVDYDYLAIEIGDKSFSSETIGEMTTLVKRKGLSKTFGSNVYTKIETPVLGVDVTFPNTGPIKGDLISQFYFATGKDYIGKGISTSTKVGAGEGVGIWSTRSIGQSAKDSAFLTHGAHVQILQIPKTEFKFWFQKGAAVTTKATTGAFGLATVETALELQRDIVKNLPKTSIGPKLFLLPKSKKATKSLQLQRTKLSLDFKMAKKSDQRLFRPLKSSTGSLSRSTSKSMPLLDLSFGSINIEDSLNLSRSVSSTKSKSKSSSKLISFSDFGSLGTPKGPSFTNIGTPTGFMFPPFFSTPKRKKKKKKKIKPRRQRKKSKPSLGGIVFKKTGKLKLEYTGFEPYRPIGRRKKRRRKK